MTGSLCFATGLLARWMMTATTLVAAAPRSAPNQEADVARSTEETPRPTNRLIHETSPYLRQHAHNPVDWYPWGPEAFERARTEDKPVFLSVGYSACHWCHVMERESFENEAVARVMNEHFICIKVDREERPDVDELYMKAVQALTGGGGWPMSVWLLPDGRPYYGGTYFPPEDRFNRPGFVRVCERMAALYREEREQVERGAEQLSDHIRQLVVPAGGAPGPFAEDVLKDAAERIVGSFDPEHGGFGGAPKFPHSMDLSLLLWRSGSGGPAREREVATFSLERMAAGGMYDQLGGGFHRYSVDERWLIPHFEKMLYDNALLGRTYLEAYLVTGDAEHRRIVEEILDYVLREMTSPEGGFYSTQDADSEGEEGKFFAWDRAEIRAVLGQELGDLAADFYGVTDAGNFEHGKSVLWRPRTLAEFAAERGLEADTAATRLAEARQRLFTAREQRVHPGRDEKILVDWNGMMISTMALAGFHLNVPRYLAAARAAAQFIDQHMVVEGRLQRTYKDGRAHLLANLGDYAQLAEGLLDLYQSCHDPAYLARARALVDETLVHFWDEEDGGFFFTADDAEALIARSKDCYDGATPSAPSTHVGNLLRLAELLGEPDYRARAERTLGLYRRFIEQYSQAVGKMMAQVAFLQSKPREIVLVGDSVAALEPMLAVLRRRLTPARVLVVKTPANAAALAGITGLVEGREAIEGKATAYVCQDFVCAEPVTDVAAFEALLDG